VPPVGEVLVLRLPDAPMTGSPDLAPLPHPSQIGVGFSDFTQIGVG
jgi:hypothetical protein